MQWASRRCWAGRSSTAQQAERAVPARWGTQIQTAAGWATGRRSVGQNQRASSCHTEHQHAEEEEERGRTKRGEGQEPGGRGVEEKEWTEPKTTSRCEQKQRVYMFIETVTDVEEGISVILTMVGT